MRDLPVFWPLSRKEPQMRTPSLLLRCCSIIIPLIHLVILSCLFYPLSDGVSTWQGGFQYQLTPAVVGNSVTFNDVVFLALFQLGPLVLPPLAAWVAFRFPTRLVSLVGLWISLALTFMACLLQVLPFFSRMPPGLSLLPDLSLAGLITLILPLSFGLSSILCLALALRLPLQKRSALRMRRSEALAVMGAESGERSRLSAEGRPLAQVSKGFGLTIAASFGLLCHLLIALSLFFPYVDYYDTYGQAGWPAHITGWQLLGEPFQPVALRITTLMPPLSVHLAMVLLVTLILPALIYLVCLAPWPLKGELRDKRLRISVSLGYVLNLIGLSLSSFFVALSLLSHGGDLHDPFQNTDLAFAVPPIAFLFSLACSSVVVTHLRPRSGPGVREGELQRATMPSHVSLEQKYLIFGFVALLGLITLVGTGLLAAGLSLSRLPFPNDGVLGPSSGVSTLIGWDLSRGEEFRFGVSVANISDKTLVLHPITFPLGLAPSLQLRHEVVGSMFPLKDPTHVTTIGAVPVEGYHLAPHTAVGITLTVVATAQGTYTIGPATAHADAPFLFTTVQVARTYTNSALLCVEVDEGVCRKAQQALSG
jgi:hypothetical protein